jgi:hypothetical protein
MNSEAPETASALQGGDEKGACSKDHEYPWTEEVDCSKDLEDPWTEEVDCSTNREDPWKDSPPLREKKVLDCTTDREDPWKKDCMSLCRQKVWVW